MASFQLTAVASLGRALRVPADGLASLPPQAGSQARGAAGYLHPSTPSLCHVSALKIKARKKKKSPLPNEITE